MREVDSDSAENVEYEEFAEHAFRPAETHQINDLMRVKMLLTAELGKRRMSVRDVVELRKGSIVQLDKLAGEMAELCVNGVQMAKGEVVVIGDNLHVRISEIAGATTEKLEGLGE